MAPFRQSLFEINQAYVDFPSTGFSDLASFFLSFHHPHLFIIQLPLHNGKAYSRTLVVTFSYFKLCSYIHKLNNLIFL